MTSSVDDPCVSYSKSSFQFELAFLLSLGDIYNLLPVYLYRRNYLDKSSNLLVWDLLTWLFQVFRHKGFCCSIYHDLLLCVRCACFLADTIMLLDLSICPHNETANPTHDQVQICPFQYWKAGRFFNNLVKFLRL